jgi:hypothetical protein
MKRINPDTGKIFKKGDIRPSNYKQDGRLFHSYNMSRIQGDGYCQESWYTKDKLDNDNKNTLAKEGERRKAYRKKPNPKRVNPKTNKPYVKGDVKKDKIFWGYTATNLDSGYVGEIWVKKEDVLSRTLNGVTMGNIRRRAKKLGVPIDIDGAYLFSIYPRPPICPILGIELEMGVDDKGTNKTSPSLDRIFPKKGYVKGNVVFISGYANMIKQDATSEEIMKVAKWLKKQEQS